MSRRFRGRCRKFEVEDGAAGRSVAIADAAAERVDDAVTDRQAEARPLANGFRREERLEQRRLVIRRNARPRILDFKKDAAVDVAGTDGDPTREPPRGKDGLLRVDDKVQKHLLQ